MLNIIDAIIVLGLLSGIVLGFKMGVIKSGMALLGTIFVLVIAYLFKNPVSVFLYSIFPFFGFSGHFEGITSLNILIYESISFIIVALLLGIIITIILKITNIIDKFLEFTFILNIPSKILGAILGFVEGFVVLFVVLFIFSQFTFSQELLRDSKYTNIILSKTPLLSNVVSNTYNSFEEIYDIASECKKDKNICNQQAFEVLLKHKIITSKNAQTLVDNGKIDIVNGQNIIDKYKEVE